MKPKQQANVTPINIGISDIPISGLKVNFRYGECFEDEIKWDSPQDGILFPNSHCNLKRENGFVVNNGCGWGYAGHEESTSTWWRYKDEVTSGTYREHCLQILALL